MIGSMLGPYRVLEKIGEGGMGEVYKAKDTRLDRSVAIKVLPPDFSADPDRRRRFDQEAKVIAALNHPNIVTLHSIEEAEGLTFLTMELVEGTTLGELIPHGGLPLGRLLALAIPLVDAVDGAHEKGITHRDLKPTNVMVTPEGRVKVLDFGLAKLREDAPIGQGTTLARAAPTTGEGRILGTVAYMSPEQAEGKPLDHRSDIFSLGVMLYEMATGERPFKGDTSVSVLSAILRDVPPPASELNPRVPREVVRVIRRCLAKDREQRYQSAKDLRIELEELKRESDSGELAREQLAASTAQAPARTPAKRMRWRLLAGVAAVILGTGAAIVWWSWRGEPPAAAPPKPTHTQVTFTGGAMSPALSPDGRTIAHVVDPDDGLLHLVVRDASGGQALEIWRGDAHFSSLRWLPDGSHVAKRVMEGEEHSPLLLIPRLGGEPRRVPGTYGPYFDVSPDGTRWASAYQAASNGLVVSGTDELKPVTIDLPTSRWLTGLEWSRVTNRLAVVTGEQDSTWAVWTFMPDGTDRRRVLGGERAVGMVICWSGSEDVLYLLRGRHASTVTDLLRIPTSTNVPPTPELLMSGLPSGQSCQVSADSRRLVHDRQSWESNIFRVALEPGGPTPAAITRGTASFQMPHVSQDGRWIAATRNQEIVRIPVEGGEPFVIGKGVGGNWSPDGRQLAFIDDRGRGERVWVADADGQQAREVQGSEGVVNWQVMWLSNQRLAWAVNQAQDFKFHDLVTGRDELLLGDAVKGTVHDLCPSPKGDVFAVDWQREKTGLWLISWPSRAARLVAPDLRPFGWSADGAWIYAHNAQTSQVVRVSLKTGKVDPLASLLGWLGSTSPCSMMPDRKWAVCAPSVVKSDIWIIDNFDPHVPSPKH